MQILNSHTHFMKDLEDRLQNWKLQGIVGDIFTKLSGSYHVSRTMYSNSTTDSGTLITGCASFTNVFRLIIPTCLALLVFSP